MHACVRACVRVRAINIHTILCQQYPRPKDDKRSSVNLIHFICITNRLITSSRLCRRLYRRHLPHPKRLNGDILSCNDKKAWSSMSFPNKGTSEKRNKTILSIPVWNQVIIIIIIIIIIKPTGSIVRLNTN